MQLSQDRSGNDALAIRDLMAVRSRQPVDGHVGNARTEAGVWSTLVVEVDNPTPIVLSYGNSVTRGIHGSVVPSPCTRCSSNRGTLSVGVASRRSEIVYR